jgi:Family of unknown function (DUF5856)
MSQLQETLIKLFFDHQIQIKMLHFQTKSYGAHKSLDAYLEKFLNNFDKYMEVSQGINGRLKASKMEFKVTMMTDSTVASILDDFLGALRNSNKQLQSDLTGIVDEMMADIDQLKYLLTFK